MSTDKYLEALDPDIIERFKEAIAIRKWPDGRALTQQQLETCMQAVITYEQHHVEEHNRTAYVPPKVEPCDTKGNEEAEDTIKWKDNN